MLRLCYLCPELGVEPPSGFAEGFDVHNTASESLRMPVVIAVSNILPVLYIHAHAGLLHSGIVAVCVEGNYRIDLLINPNI